VSNGSDRTAGLTVVVQVVSKITVARHTGNTPAHLKNLPDIKIIVALLGLNDKTCLSNHTFEAVKDMADALGFISSWGDYKIRTIPCASA